MTFTAAIKSGFQRYFKFFGRASRSEYWYFVLFVVIAIPTVGFFFGVRFGLVSAFLLFIPLLTVTVRRLRDINKSEGWAYLGALMLLLGSFSLLLTSAMLLGGVESYIYFFCAGVGLLSGLFVAMAYYLTRKSVGDDET